MPLLKKKIYNLTPSPRDLKTGEELFVIPETKECFRSYDEYIAKVFLYSSQHWSCQYTGKSGLTYNDALSSENKALKQLKSFPDPFKEPVLKCIHKAEGNVKEVVDKCMKFLTTHYCLQEDVVIINTKNGKKSPGVIINVINSSVKKNVDLDVDEKENDGVNATGTQVSGWKYSVQLTESDVVLQDILPDEIKRKTKLPSKELLKMFIKYSAERLPVDAKDMWLLKDDLVQKYNLPTVSKSSLGLKEQKNSLRSPLDTITGRNGDNVPKQKTKKISPKNVKDPSQRTLNFFVQTSNANTITKDCTTPTKDKSSEKLKGSPVIAELKICLTPKSKIKEVVEKSSGKSKADSVRKGDGSKTEGKTARSLFSVEQDVTEVTDKAVGVEKTQITIQDDEEDFVTKKPNVKPGKEKKKCREDAKTSAGKKITEKNIETNLKEKETVHSNKLDNVDKLEKINNTEHDVIMLDDDFSEKEKKIVKKNALKKQKTLSQMFKVNTPKSSSKIQAEHEDKTNIVIDLPRDVETASSKNELGKTLELPSPKTGLELVRLPLPSPKPVSAVPEHLRRYYGDILMITEFIHFYGNFLSQDGDLKCRPDDLVSGLINEGPKNQVFVRILIGFLQVLLKDLRRQDSSKEFSDLGVGLLDMRVSESTVGELTRLYLQHCHNGEHSMKRTNKEVLTTRKLTQHILMDLNHKDIVNLNAAQKLEVLTYLLDRILISEVFYSHQQELEENRRQTWVKKIELDTEIRELIQEQKKLEEVKNPQKEIDKFLEKCNENNGEKALDKEPINSEQVRDEMNGTENITQENNMESTGNHGMKEDDSTSINLTKRQETAAKSKIEKEKFDEMRRLGEQLYQKKQKAERFKEVINQVRDSRRLESLGSDRNHSRYWLCQSHPEALFVEKIASPDIKAMECPDIGDVDNENLKDGEIDPLSSEGSWFYYNTKEQIDRLISSLSFHDENESALKQKLKALKKQSKKLHFEKRQTDSTKSCSEEDSIDHLGSLKAEMSGLASRITAGDMGCMEDLEIWTEDVMSRSSLADLVTLALELASTVKIKSLWKKLGDREEWLKEDWVQAVKGSMMSSRLCFCIAMLDYCIMWDTSTLYIKCKICRRSAGTMAVCDKCRTGFHIECLRPALDEVPDEEWLCPVCRPADEQRRRRAVTKGNPEIVDEESQEENDDYCDVCGGDGELICCDNCPKVYHKECHDPPLRNIPRGVWKCCSCQGRRPTAKKRSLPADSEEYSDLESSQDELADDSSYSESSSEESGSEVEDPAAAERAERAQRRELAREEEEAQSKRSKKKKKANKRKGKKKASLDDTEDREEDVENKKCRGTIREYFNEKEDSSPRDKRARLGRRVTTDVKTNQSFRNEENARRSSRKRKCSSSEDECHIAKRKPRQTSELKMCEKLLKDLMHHEDSWPFIEPVDISEVPDYLEVVACPMDFGTIKRILNAFEYSSYEECISDIKLVFANSDQYNLSTSDHGLAGISLGAYFKEILPNYFPKYELQELPQKSSRLGSRKRRS